MPWPGRAVVVCAALAILGTPDAACAYVDPGAGSLAVQLVLGGVAGLVVLARLAWRRFRDRLKGPPSRL